MIILDDFTKNLLHLLLFYKIKLLIRNLLTVYIFKSRPLLDFDSGDSSYIFATVLLYNRRTAVLRTFYYINTVATVLRIPLCTLIFPTAALASGLKFKSLQFLRRVFTSGLKRK